MKGELKMTKTYDSLPKWARILLQLFLGWPISCLYRVFKYTETKNTTTLLVGVLCVFAGALFWIIDLVTTVLNDKITVLAD